MENPQNLKVTCIPQKKIVLENHMLPLFSEHYLENLYKVYYSHQCTIYFICMNDLPLTVHSVSKHMATITIKTD